MSYSELIWRRVHSSTDPERMVRTVLDAAVIATDPQGKCTLRAYRETQWQLPLNNTEGKQLDGEAYWTTDKNYRNGTLEAALQRHNEQQTVPTT